MATIPLDTRPTKVVAGEGFVWVRQLSTKEPTIKIDPLTNRKCAVLAVGRTFVPAIAVGAASLWVADVEQRRVAGVVLGERTPTASIARIDPRTDQIVARIPIGKDITDIAIGAGSVWALHGGYGLCTDSCVFRIDPQTNRVVAQIPVNKGTVEIAAGAGYVWLMHGVEGWTPGSRQNSVTRIDPRTNRIVGDPIPVPGILPTLAVGRGAVWVATGSLPPPESVVRGLAVLGGAVWLASANSSPREGVIRLDPESGQPVGAHLYYPAPEIAAGEYGVWATCYDLNGSPGLLAQVLP